MAIKDKAKQYRRTSPSLSPVRVSAPDCGKIVVLKAEPVSLSQGKSPSERQKKSIVKQGVVSFPLENNSRFWEIVDNTKDENTLLKIKSFKADVSHICTFDLNEKILKSENRNVAKNVIIGIMMPMMIDYMKDVTSLHINHNHKQDQFDWLVDAFRAATKEYNEKAKAIKGSEIVFEPNENEPANIIRIAFKRADSALSIPAPTTPL